MATLPLPPPSVALLIAPFLLSGAWTSQALAQPADCDNPVTGSGACLPWGFHRVNDLQQSGPFTPPGDIGEVGDISRDGSVLVGLTEPATTLSDVTHFRFGGRVESIGIQDIGANDPGYPRGYHLTSSDGRYVTFSARITGGPPGEDLRAYRWDTDTGNILRLPSGPTIHLTKFGWLNGHVEPAAKVSISSDGSTITGRGVAFNDQGDYMTDVYGFRWLEGVGTSDVLQGPFDEAFVPNVVSGDGSTAAGSRVFLSGLPAVIEDAATWESGIGTVFDYNVNSRVTASNHDGSLLAGTTSFAGTPTAGLWRRSPGTFEYMDDYFHPARITYDGQLITGVNYAAPPPLGGTEPWIVHSDLPGAAYGEWFFSYVRDRSGIPLWFGEDPPSLYGSADPILLTSESGNTFSMFGADWYVNIPPVKVVVMGDSYSSGESLEPYDPTTDQSTPQKNHCHRSTKAYGRLIRPPQSNFTFASMDELDGNSPRTGFSFDFIACSGAKTKNVNPSATDSNGVNISTGQYNEDVQLLQGVVDTDTDLVILTIGGNDAHFADIAAACVRPFSDCRWQTAKYPSPSTGTLQTWSKFLPDHIDTTVRESVRATFQAIKAETQDHAALVVLGYPRPVSGNECTDLALVSAFGEAILGEITAEEQAWLRTMTDFLNEVIGNTADEVGIHYLPVTYEFLTHAACPDELNGPGTGDAWITGLTWLNKELKRESLHPTIDGHAAYAARVQAFLEDMGSYSNGAFASGMPKNPSPTSQP